MHFLKNKILKNLFCKKKRRLYRLYYSCYSEYAYVYFVAIKGCAV